MNMQKTDAKKLLLTLKELSAKDVIVDTLLKLAETEIRYEYQSNNVYSRIDRDYIDQNIIDKRILNLANQIISVQTERCRVLELEVEQLKSSLQV